MLRILYICTLSSIMFNPFVFILADGTDETKKRVKYIAGNTSLLTPQLEIVFVGLNTVDTLPDYIPPYSEVLVTARVNGGTENDLTITTVLNWRVNSNTNAYVAVMPLLYNMLVQEYRYVKRIDAYPDGTAITWWVTATDADGNTATSEEHSFVIGTLSIDHEHIPTAFQILGNYPNPFNPHTDINFSVQYPSELSLSIYSTEGKLIRIINLGSLRIGNHSVSWNGRDQKMSQVPSGIYIYVLGTDKNSGVGKMTLLK